MDLFKKIDDTRGGTLGKYQEVAHGYFAFPKLEGEIGPWMKFRGKAVINWSMENYLGLANDPEVRLADTQATTQWGLGYPMGTRIISGQTTRHEELEDRIAQFIGKEDAFIVNFEYQAMISAIDTLCNRFDVIVYDSEANPAIIDGVLLHKAKGGKCFVFAHNDVENCRKKIQLAQSYITKEKEDGGIMVVTDGVFGITGETGRIAEIAALKDEFEFSLMIDDAHGFGIMGANGRGTAEAQGVSDKVDLVFGSFSKSMAAIGGFIAGTEKVVNYLRYNMRSQIFDESLPMATVLGLEKRLDILQRQDERRERLWTVTRALQEGLKASGFDIGPTNSAITPVYIHPSKEPTEAQGEKSIESADDQAINGALNLVMDMRENYGIFCPIMKHPVVPVGTLMIRFLPTANHSMDDVIFTLRSMGELRAKLEAGQYDNHTLLR